MELAKIFLHCCRRSAWFSGAVSGGSGGDGPDGIEVSLWHVRDQHHRLPDYRFLAGFSGKARGVERGVEVPIPVGFVGAYSTFSTFEWETFSNLQTGAFLTASLYVVLSIVLGLAAVWCGVLLARAFA